MVTCLDRYDQKSCPNSTTVSSSDSEWVRYAHRAADAVSFALRLNTHSSFLLQVNLTRVSLDNEHNHHAQGTNNVHNQISQQTPEICDSQVRSGGGERVLILLVTLKFCSGAALPHQRALR